jgi:hypothetical protein
VGGDSGGVESEEREMVISDQVEDRRVSVAVS